MNFIDALKDRKVISKKEAYKKVEEARVLWVEETCRIRTGIHILKYEVTQNEDESVTLSKFWYDAMLKYLEESDKINDELLEKLYEIRNL